jgi:protein involved in plasmid replication-relaxation
MTPLLVLRRGLGVRGVARRPSGPGPAGHGLLSGRDLRVLAWTGEQYAVQVDQLEVLLGCSERTVQRVLARLRAAGLVSTRRVLVDEPAWVLPTVAGLRACSSSFGVWEPKLGLLAHVAAVNDVRLHVEAMSPGSEWVCERALARERRAGQHLPDGLVLLDGQRVAVEVELTVKSRRRVTAILDDLARRFEATVYFCAPGPHRLLGEMAGSGRWPGLSLRELPARVSVLDSADDS